MARLSFRAYAQHRGVSPAAVSKAVKEGRITAELDPTTGERWIDAEKADRQWAANTDPAKQEGSKVVIRRRDGLPEPEPAEEPSGRLEAVSPADGGGPPKLQDSRAWLEHYKALAKQADYLERVASLVHVDDVRRESFEAARALREAILSVPDRLHAELAAETDPNRVHARITEELIIALESVASRPKPSERTA